MSQSIFKKEGITTNLSEINKDLTRVHDTLLRARITFNQKLAIFKDIENDKKNKIRSYERISKYQIEHIEKNKQLGKEDYKLYRSLKKFLKKFTVPKKHQDKIKELIDFSYKIRIIYEKLIEIWAFERKLLKEFASRSSRSKNELINDFKKLLMQEGHLLEIKDITPLGIKEVMGLNQRFKKYKLLATRKEIQLSDSFLVKDGDFINEKDEEIFLELIEQWIMEDIQKGDQFDFIETNSKSEIGMWQGKSESNYRKSFHDLVTDRKGHPGEISYYIKGNNKKLEVAFETHPNYEGMEHINIEFCPEQNKNGDYIRKGEGHINIHVLIKH